jgi:hypothetical protein
MQRKPALTFTFVLTHDERAALMKLAKRLPGYRGKPSMGEAVRHLIENHDRCSCAETRKAG